ncbi:MAG: phosphotransferase, partial [Candidatus Dormibacterales bacterium]
IGRFLTERSTFTQVAPLAGSLEYRRPHAEPTTMLDQRSAYQAVRRLSSEAVQLLRNHLAVLPEDLRPLAHRVIDLDLEMQSRARRVLERPITSMRIRCHGDFHLGQVLFTGTDFVIIDFEGEPARSLRERRYKRWPMRDVAGMLRSFRYAAHMALEAQPPPHRAALDPAARRWAQAVSQAYLTSYLVACGEARFQPSTQGESDLLLEANLLEKALYELRYELNNRPGWVGIPLAGLLELLEG